MVITAPARLDGSWCKRRIYQDAQVPLQCLPSDSLTESLAYAVSFQKALYDFVAWIIHPREQPAVILGAKYPPATILMA